MAAGVLADSPLLRGLRPVNLRTDLGGIADLIELCFGATMDESGRAGLREMRMVSQSPSLTFLYDGVDRVLGGLELGFVWLEDGKIIGNVSVSRATMPGVVFAIANVAVHPDFRRRGIARELMEAALDLVRERRGKAAILQVDASNDTAQRLYSRLGFQVERTFNKWVRSPFARVPPPLPRTVDVDITLRQPTEWRKELALAELVRPNSSGGLGWMRPTVAEHFRPSFVRTVADWTLGRSEEHYIIRHQREIVASLRLCTSFGGTDRLELLVHPSVQSKYESLLLNTVLRRLEGRRRSATIEHPADDLIATEVLAKYAFERRYTLVHMRRNLE